MAKEDVDHAEEAEELEEASEAISKSEGRGSLALWFGVLGSPLAWAGHLGINYSLEEWFACSAANEHKGEILGLGVHTVSIIVNTAMLAIAVLSGLVAYTCWKKLRGQTGDEKTERARWMAFAGMIEVVLFLLAIVLGFVPPFLIHACETTP